MLAHSKPSNTVRATGLYWTKQNETHSPKLPRNLIYIHDLKKARRIASQKRNQVAKSRDKNSPSSIAHAKDVSWPSHHKPSKHGDIGIIDANNFIYVHRRKFWFAKFGCISLLIQPPSVVSSLPLLVAQFEEGH